MKFVDLFAGLGGFHLAAASLGARCVFASEIDANLRSVYNENFGVEPFGDIRAVKPCEVPVHDLLCAGFPCQPFSKAGEQMGWQDAVRGTVFYNIVEILRQHNPKYLLLENVAHFVNHDSGNTYLKVKTALEKLGYFIKSTKLSPHQFGVPQIRERMYLVGCRDGLENFEWPTEHPENEKLSVKSVLDTNPTDAVKLSSRVVDCLNTWQEFLTLYPADVKLPSFPIWSMEFLATYPYSEDSLQDIPLSELRNYRGVYGSSLKAHFRRQILELVPSHARAEKGAFPSWKKNFLKQNRELYKKNSKILGPWLKKIKQFPPSLQKFEWNCGDAERSVWKQIIQFRASGVRVKRPTTSPSLVAMTTTQIPIIGWEKRYMTAIECARLQSMQELKVLPLGGKAFKALGNAVNVTVAKAILKNLLNRS